MKLTEIPQFADRYCWHANYSFMGYLLQLKKWEDDKFFDQLDMNPDFQRDHVWNQQQQIAFMEYFLQGGVSGRAFYFNHPGWCTDFCGVFTIVDGKQRTHAFQEFVEGKFPVFGHYFEEFEDHTWVHSGSSNLMVDIYINTLKTKAEVLRWYIGFNAGGTPHSKEEIDRVKKLLAKEENNAGMYNVCYAENVYGESCDVSFT